MDECGKISESLSGTVDTLKEFQQPQILNKKMCLSNYQLIGLHWLVLMYEKKLNAILADEMGLGKTIQVIAFLAYLREVKAVSGPHLIVVPASTMDNWLREINTWCPSIICLQYYGNQLDRADLREEICAKNVEFDIILTTYSMLHNPDDKKLFKRIKFNYAVFDEAHMLKNMKSSRYADLMKVRGKRRLLLTGTPLQNNLLELLSLLIFTMPEMFEGKTQQVQALFASKESGEKQTIEHERIQQARKIMQPFVLRRLKEDVLKELPTKRDEKLICVMTPDQEFKYMELIESFTREIRYMKKNIFEDAEIDGENGTMKKPTGMLMQLRKAANHPLLLRTCYDDKKLKTMASLMLKEPTHNTADKDLIFEDMQVMHDFELHMLCKQYKSLNRFILEDEKICDSGKFKKLDTLLLAFKKNKERVLIFSQFTMMLDIIEEYMKIKRYKYLRLDGSTKVDTRLDLIDEFNDDGSYFVFLLSTKAGGLGINLTSANKVIIHDIDFNPYNDKQAEDRCHRVGQTNEVTVYRLISKNSVEEGMLKICEYKLKLGQEISQNKSKGKSYIEKTNLYYELYFLFTLDDDIDTGDVKTLLRQALGL